MYPNPLRSKLKAGETILGTTLPAPSSLLAGMILDTEPDFLWIDLEHQQFGTEALGAIPVQVRQRGVAPMIRVAWNDPALIKKAYDVGAVAVMVPQVDNAEQAAQVVARSKYPPEGNRGLSPMWTRTAGEDWTNVLKTANEETVVIVQIESREAYDNIDEIKAVPGIDVLFFGPLDMSAAVGTIGDPLSDEVQSLMKAFPEKLEGSGIAAATTLVDLDEIKQKLDWGFRFMNVGNPVAYGCSVIKQNFDELRRR